MKKIKVYRQSDLEDELELMFGLSRSNARTLGAIMRGVAGDIIRGVKQSEIRAGFNGEVYKINITKE